MKYETKYPKAVGEMEVEEGLVKENKRGSCVCCRCKTYFFDLSLCGYVCSEECEAEAWQEVNE